MIDNDNNVDLLWHLAGEAHGRSSSLKLFVPFVGLSDIDDQWHGLSDMNDLWQKLSDIVTLWWVTSESICDMGWLTWIDWHGSLPLSFVWDGLDHCVLTPQVCHHHHLWKFGSLTWMTWQRWAAALPLSFVGIRSHW